MGYNRTLMDISIEESRRIQKYKKIVEKHFKETLHKEINWKSPTTYNEKLQVLKVRESTDELWRFADKAQVREFVEATIGKEHMVPLIAVYDRVEDIDFDNLPDSFILKATHGSSWNIICNNKNYLDRDEVRDKFKKWLSLNYCDDFGMERQYRKIKPRIICEANISKDNCLPIDYKIFCFKGVPKFIQVDLERATNHLRDYYDLDWNILPFGNEYPRSGQKTDKPSNLSEMIEIAQKLSKNFEHVRVDLYFQNQKIYFGELTFTPQNGMGRFDPPEYDEIIGSYLSL